MGLEDKLKGYGTAVAAGQGFGLLTTLGGVLNAERIANYVPGIQNLLNKTYNVFGYIVAPGLPILAAISNFIGDQIGTFASLYALNWKKYKGKFFSFIKEGANLGVRHLGSYLISYPLAIAASTAAIATGLLAGPIAVIAPYVIESVITGLGYLFSTKGYRGKTFAQNYSPNPSPNPAYSKPSPKPTLQPALAPA